MVGHKISNKQFVLLRRAINIKKVKFLLTLYGPLAPPTFYLVKPKLLALPPSPPQSQQKLHSERSFNFDGTPNKEERRLKTDEGEMGYFSLVDESMESYCKEVVLAVLY